MWRFTSSAADNQRHVTTAERASLVEQRVMLEQMRSAESCKDAVESIVREHGESYLADGWGVPMRVECEGSSTTIRSAGPDGRWQTPDDREL